MARERDIHRYQLRRRDGTWLEYSDIEGLESLGDRPYVNSMMVETLKDYQRFAAYYANLGLEVPYIDIVLFGYNDEVIGEYDVTRIRMP